MNQRIVTGWLTQDVSEAWTPATPTEAAKPRLVFALNLRDRTGFEWQEKCRIEDPALFEKARKYLVAGAQILVRGEPTARPFEKHNRTAGIIRELIVEEFSYLRLPKVVHNSTEDAA